LKKVQLSAKITAMKWDLKRAQRLESEERKKEENPEKILQLFELKEGETLVDVGCGPGFYTLPAARIVGSQGKVFALDISAELLEALKKKVPPELEKVVEIYLIEASNFPLNQILKGVSANIVLLANLLHELEDKRKILKEAASVLAPQGRLGIVEWRKEPMSAGPPLNERLSWEEINNLLEKAGFKLKKTFPIGKTRQGYLAEIQT
jgi:ubiquinone/menaquinone biosynthesis C-methylase UbiE